MARSIQSFTESMDKTLAKRVEDHKQMMEKSAQRWFMSLVLALLSVVVEGECDAECVARDGCLHAFDRLDL